MTVLFGPVRSAQRGAVRNAKRIPAAYISLEFLAASVFFPGGGDFKRTVLTERIYCRSEATHYKDPIFRHGTPRVLKIHPLLSPALVVYTPEY